MLFGYPRFVPDREQGGLDVAFNEDHSRKRAGNAAQNFSLINRIALNLLKNEKSAKVGVKGKKLKAGWD